MRFHFMFFSKSFLFVSLLTLLVACGGGGGKKVSSSASSDASSSSSSRSSAVAQIAQTLHLEQSGEIKKLVGQHFSNKATGQGSGIIVYESDAPGVASTDMTGRVLIHAIGTARITASISADERYLAASQTFTVKVLPSEISISAWIGAEDTQVIFSPDVTGFDFYRTTAADCDLATIANCANGSVDILTTNTLLDTTATLNQAAVYALKQESYQGKLSIDSLFDRNGGDSVFYPVSRHAVLEYDGKLWLIGPTTTPGLMLDTQQIWTSIDGISWVRVNVTIPSNRISRFMFNVVNFGEHLWMIAGEVGSTAKEVYRLDTTEFGVQWTLVVDENIFSGRFGHQVIVFNNKLWVFGGTTVAINKNDAWSSVDGSHWVQETEHAEFSERFGHQVVVFNNKLWLIGGFDGALQNDIWSSSDGVNWTEESSDANFTARYDHRVVNFNEKLWLIGGFALTEDGSDTVHTNDIWSSVNGVDWVREVENAPFSPRVRHQVVHFNGALFVIGGNDGENKNDVWASTDGVNWRKAFHGSIQISE